MTRRMGNSLLLALLWPTFAGAAESHAAFALIVGVNQSVDRDLAPLRYADDDAANYLELFRTLGARTYLLARLDENTRRLHPQAAAEARLPVRAELEQTVTQLANDVKRARAEGVSTEVYFVYAGHGNIRDDQGYISLEDARLTGPDLAHGILEKVSAERVHFVIDACGSYFLAYSRGFGGERRSLAEGFSQSAQLSADPRVGLLLSTSSARESHEWEAFEGGVFSHEVRSGLLGAADADGDGEVSYQEIAAFVQRANASIPGDRFRSDVWARPPPGTDQFADLRVALRRRLEIDGAHASRYLFEDGRGVRLADFHSATGQAVRLLRPMTSAAPLFLRRLSDEQEYVVATTDEVVALSALSPNEPRVHSRGAAHEAFEHLFELPFDRGVVDRFQLPAATASSEMPQAPRARTRIATLAAWGVGVASAGGAVGSFFWTRSQANGLSASASQADAVACNGRIALGNSLTIALSSVAGAAAFAGTLLLLWPQAPVTMALVPNSNGLGAAVSGRF